MRGSADVQLRVAAFPASTDPGEVLGLEGPNRSAVLVTGGVDPLEACKDRKGEAPARVRGSFVMGHLAIVNARGTQVSIGRVGASINVISRTVAAGRLTGGVVKSRCDLHPLSSRANHGGPVAMIAVF